MSDYSGLVVVVAAAGAMAAGATALARPRLAFGILFLLASFSRATFSRATLETPLGTMRLEMPAIAVTAIVLPLGGRFAALGRVPRSSVVIALAFGLYADPIGSIPVADESIGVAGR